MSESHAPWKCTCRATPQPFVYSQNAYVTCPYVNSESFGRRRCGSIPLRLLLLRLGAGSAHCDFMQNTHTFLIESDQSKHDLLLDRQTIARFPTLQAAEAAANDIASRMVPGAALQFEVDLMSTLLTLEIRSATIEW